MERLIKRRMLLIGICVAGASMISTAFAQWQLVDSDTTQAIIPYGEHCYYRILPSSASLEINTPYINLTSAAQEAINRAPTWLQLDLKDNFRRMDPSFQDIYANIINGSFDPYVDEICFIVAHTAPQTLSGPMDPAIIVENVSSLYAIDSFLNYVQIVDYGNSITGGDYYSTTRYRVYEEPDTLEIELPREKYYWYVVHSKLHKEVPNYIDPNTGNPASPPTGAFWRDFLMNCADPGYPLLRDMLDTCATLWNCQQNTLDNGAVGALTQWIQDVMTFQSYPHHDQPVRIYRLHIGTCSVHSYLTSAAARAALVPTTVSVMYSDNHKINEFWDRRWVSWEPVNTYIDYPQGYENWGWNVAAEWNWRGDGYIRDNTQQYTEVCSLRVNVTDVNGNPVDGARIKIYSSPCVAWGATVGWTIEDGFKLFLLGDNRTFSAQVVSEVGNYPAFGMETIITNSIAGANYTWDVALPGAVPTLSIFQDTLPPNPTDDYRIVLDYNLPWEILYGDNLDDNDRFSEKVSPGKIDFFICDEENFSLYSSGDDFEAFEINLADTAGTVEFVLPTNDSWYAVFSNRCTTVLSEVLEVVAQLYQSVTTPDITVTLTPYNPPILIPQTGGSFEFNIAGTNNEPDIVNCDVWCDVTLPNGSVYGPVLGPVNVDIPGNTTLDRDRTQLVPGNAPAGDYTYSAYIGIYPNIIWNADSFPFSKEGVVGVDENWANWGEPLETQDGLSISPPKSFILHDPYPNPFNPITDISFELPGAGFVNLTVYDISGRVVANLVHDWRKAGTYKVTFDGSNLASGVYLYQLQAGEFSAIRKMVLTK